MIAFEASKVLRSRRPWLAALALAAFLVLMLVGFYTYAQNETGGQAEFRYTFENRSYFNGLTFTVYAFYFAQLLIIPVFVATEGAVQIAGEAESRTLALLLSRPVSKARILFSKLLVTWCFAAWLCVLLMGASLAAGLGLIGLGDLDLYPGVLQMTARHQHLAQDVALVRLAGVCLWAAFALGAEVAFSLWISTLSRRAVEAAAIGVALYLVAHVISGVHLFETLRPWLFTSYLSGWRALLQEQVPWSNVLQDLTYLSAFTALFLGLALRRFRKREEA